MVRRVAAMPAVEGRRQAGGSKRKADIVRIGQGISGHVRPAASAPAGKRPKARRGRGCRPDTGPRSTSSQRAPGQKLGRCRREASARRRQAGGVSPGAVILDRERVLEADPGQDQNPTMLTTKPSHVGEDAAQPAREHRQDDLAQDGEHVIANTAGRPAGGSRRPARGPRLDRRIRPGRQVAGAEGPEPPCCKRVATATMATAHADGAERPPHRSTRAARMIDDDTAPARR